MVLPYLNHTGETRTIMHRIANITRHIAPAARNIQQRNMSAAATATAAAPKEEIKHWALHYQYVPDAFEKRVPFRADHLALTSKYKSSGSMLSGGAYADPPMGALLTFHSTRSEVEKFIKEDPYVTNGVVTDYKIREWTVVVGSSSNPNYAGVTPIAAGESFPKGQTLYEGTPAGAVNVDQLLKGKKVIIFGVPGAFTPGCSKVRTHSDTHIYTHMYTHIYTHRCHSLYEHEYEYVCALPTRPDSIRLSAPSNTVTL